MESKKYIVFLVLSLFLMSIVPIGVLADDTRSGTSGSISLRSDNSGTASVDDKDDDDLDEDEETDDEDEAEDDGSEVKSEFGERSDGEQRMKSVEKIKVAGLEVETRVDIRVKQREHFEAAIEKCKEVRDAEDCEEKLRVRLELVQKLEEKDIGRLEKLREKREEVASKLEELKKKEHFVQFKLDGSKARLVANEKMENAEKKFEEARERFEEAREKQQDEYKAFVEARAKWKAECKSEESEECRALDAKLKENVNNYLLQTLNSIIHELEKVRSRIEGSDTLTEEEAAKMLADVDAKLAQAEALKVKIGSELTKEELQAVIGEVRELWDEVKHDLKMHAGRVVNARMGGILVQSEKMSVKLTKVLERMAEQGTDTTTVESLVDQFNAHLEASKAAYVEAQVLFKASVELKSEEKGTKVKEAQARMNAAQDALREAHEVLQEIHKVLKEQRQLETLEDVEEDEVEVEAEVETEA